MAVMRARAFWVVVAGALLWLVVTVALRGLADDPRFLATPSFSNVRGPAWGGDQVILPALERLEALGPINLFDRRIEDRIRGALHEVPGVAAGGEVRRHWPNRYSVSFRVHRPVAVVETGDRAIPVTHAGVALPEAPYDRATLGLLRIRGVEIPPPPLGARWRSEALLDGLATVRQLARRRRAVEALRLRWIDVSGAHDRRTGVIVGGDENLLVFWGSPRRKLGENSVEKKLDYLRFTARNLAWARDHEIDMRFDTIWRSPLDTAP